MPARERGQGGTQEPAASSVYGSCSLVSEANSVGRPTANSYSDLDLGHGEDACDAPRRLGQREEIYPDLLKAPVQRLVVLWQPLGLLHTHVLCLL